MKRSVLISLLTVAALGLRPAPAAADITAFWGVTPEPAARSARGFSVGVSILVVGFEFDYSKTVEDLAKTAPGLTTYAFNALVMTPTKLELYGTIGAGLFSESLDGQTVRNLTTNIGGGVKVPLFGPVRLRIDYRVFALRGSARYKTPQRLYAGVNIRF